MYAVRWNRPTGSFYFSSFVNSQMQDTFVARFEATKITAATYEYTVDAFDIIDQITAKHTNITRDDIEVVKIAF